MLHSAANGDVVLNERVDRFDMGGTEVSVQVMGVFEIRDGKIARWRDYFDMASFQKQSRAAPQRCPVKGAPQSMLKAARSSAAIWSRAWLPSGTAAKALTKPWITPS